MSILRKSFVSIAVLLCLSAQAKVKLPSIISDGMVLQQNTEAALWGTAAPGAKVTVRPSWTKSRTTAVAGNDGKWLIRVATPAAGGPYEIQFNDGDKLTVSNVLIGEVWYCSGQSNMSMVLQGNPGQLVEGSAETIMSARADVPIRRYKVEIATSDKPLDDCTGCWHMNTPEEAAGCSAIAYFFAQTLYAQLQIPIGIIESHWGGTIIEAWMDRESLLPFDAEDPIDCPDRAEKNRPAYIYNAMVAPLEPYTFKGMLWYQGESNRENAELYSRLQPAYVQMMRERFQNPDAPFYYVQIAPHRYRGFESRLAPVFQMMQEMNQDVIPNSAMVGTEDIGQETLIHPRKKKQVGQRLAWLALTRDYGVKGIDPYVPRVQEVRFEDGKVYLRYSSELGLYPFRTDIPGFEVAGEDRVFHDAKAQVLFNAPYNDCRTVCVSCDEVPAPVAVRYCFHDWAVGTLTNTFGIPAAAFRSDDWPCMRFDW